MIMDKELLLQNGQYAGIALLLVVVVTLLGTSLFLRTAGLFLRSQLFASSPQLQASFRRKTWRWALAFLSLAGLLISGGAVAAARLKLRLKDVVERALSRVQAQDWQQLGITTAKALGILLLSFLAARLLVTLLQRVRERLHRTEVLTAHRERLSVLLEDLRVALSVALLFGTVGLCAQLLGVPDGGVHVLGSIAYVGLAVYVSRFAAGTAHLMIDVLFELSEMLSRLESPLRYLGRFRHLSQLTKRAADYLIYVGAATWTLEQITPGSWVTHTGRLALRIIVIFYLSRVLVEVCLLMMNEFFLHRSDLDQATLQQRQTLVPVAFGLLKYGIYFVAVVTALRECGVDTTPLLAGAGVASVAVGLGAQSFVGDLVAGFFILFENLFLVGDYIEVSEVKGKVEEIGVRVTKIRDEAGLLHAIPNGEVRKVASHSKGYVNVVIDIPVPHSESLHRVFDILRARTAELRASHSEILGETDFGIEDVRESFLLLRTVTMVKPGLTNEMTSVLRLAMWEALVAASISTPYSRHMMIAPVQPSAALASPSRQAELELGHRSDIQKLKAHNFYLALDVNGNGYLEHSDMKEMGRRLIEGQQRDKGSAVALALMAHLDTFWTQMVTSLDRDADGRISQEEFRLFCSRLAQGLATHSGGAAEALNSLSDVLFTVCDHNANGTMSEGEFVQFARAHGSSDAVAAAGFRLIDRDRNGTISLEEWRHFMHDLFQSRKLNDAAAVVFGPGSRGAS